jgi:hypothetical protein
MSKKSKKDVEVEVLTLEDQEVTFPKGVIEKPVPNSRWGLSYYAWEDSVFEKLGPITEEHIGKQVRLAGAPVVKDVILQKIFAVGEKDWPFGGYQIKHPDYSFSKSIFLDSISPKPIRKKRVVKKGPNSQLALKKRKKKPLKVEDQKKISRLRRPKKKAPKDA